MSQSIWVLVQFRNDTIDEVTFGLIAEAVRIRSELKSDRSITVIALGSGIQDSLVKLNAFAVDEIICLDDERLEPYHGELFALCLSALAGNYPPLLILTAENREREDLAPRLVALLNASLATRVVDFKVTTGGKFLAVRPTANDYLYEEVALDSAFPVILSYLPAVLDSPKPGAIRPIPVKVESLKDYTKTLQTRLVKRSTLQPEALGLEDSEVIVAAGRGAATEEGIGAVQKLAHVLQGTVGGTRPVIDLKLLPFERQIGQTGKTVSPKLLINCGISGANEYTTGIEKAQTVIAIDLNPQARIFNFADLGIVGDLRQIIPLLIEALEKTKDLKTRNSEPLSVSTPKPESIRNRSKQMPE